MFRLTVLIIIILVLLFFIFRKPTDLVEGLDTFVGRMAIDDQYYYDKLFNDVTYYPNDDDGITTGWMKCKQDCPGNCMEFFVSGNAYCFPY
jgi:hypothetical protein